MATDRNPALLTNPSFKVVLLGDTGVGKSAIVRRQCYDDFTISMTPTLGASHFKVAIRLGNEVVDLRLWDTGGQEQYSALVPVYTRQAHAAIIVASFVDSVSVQNIDVWEQRLRATEERAFVVVAINKMDLAERGDTERIREMLRTDKFPHVLFISAKTGDGVREMFTLVAELVAQANVIADGVNVDQANPRKEGCC
jgi:small GTP-binding protein